MTYNPFCSIIINLYDLYSLVETGEGTSCYSSGRLDLENSDGYISSVVAEDTGRGTSRCPWVITAGSGQRINITLHDFSAVRQFSHHTTGKHGGGKHENEAADITKHRTYCHKYAGKVSSFKF